MSAFNLVCTGAGFPGLRGPLKVAPSSAEGPRPLSLRACSPLVGQAWGSGLFRAGAAGLFSGVSKTGEVKRRRAGCSAAEASRAFPGLPGGEEGRRAGRGRWRRGRADPEGPAGGWRSWWDAGLARVGGRPPRVSEQKEPRLLPPVYEAVKGGRRRRRQL